MNGEKPRKAKRVDPLIQARPKWKASVDEHDYVAAFEFLSLIRDEDVAHLIVNQLRDQDETVSRKAKDLLRAAAVPLLLHADEYVMRDLIKIGNGSKLSPVLYVRGNSKCPPIIADGYHRICASYYCDPDADVLLKLV